MISNKCIKRYLNNDVRQTSPRNRGGGWVAECASYFSKTKNLALSKRFFEYCNQITFMFPAKGANTLCPTKVLGRGVGRRNDRNLHSLLDRNAKTTKPPAKFISTSNDAAHNGTCLLTVLYTLAPSASRFSHYHSTRKSTSRTTNANTMRPLGLKNIKGTNFTHCKNIT